MGYIIMPIKIIKVINLNYLTINIFAVYENYIKLHYIKYFEKYIIVIWKKKYIFIKIMKIMRFRYVGNNYKY